MTTWSTRSNMRFGCHHSNSSRVFTIGGRTYPAARDGGAQFRYSLDTHVDLVTGTRTTSWITVLSKEGKPCGVSKCTMQ